MDVAVEDVAGDEQQHVLPAMRQAPVQPDDEDEEDDEVGTVEDHGARRPSRETNSAV